MIRRIGYLTLPVVVSVTLALPLALKAQSVSARRPGRSLINQPIDESRLISLAGNTRPQANPKNDVGAVAADFPMEHMLLQLQRPAEREAAAVTLIDDLHNRKSASYHKWLTAQQFGEAYGPSQQDIDTVSTWLKSRGFTVNQVLPSRMVIDFSGTADLVGRAFHTEIHRYSVRGAEHVANSSDPQIPEALAPVVAGVVSMHDFKPHSMRREAAKFTYGSGNSTTQAVTPADLATIYNLNPLFAAGLTGKGQTIAVVEDTNMYTESDWYTFRTTFGLNVYTSGSLATVHPGSSCFDPGIGPGGEDAEATLDAEWASAAAPDATIQIASCGSTRTTFGGLIALQNLINSSSPPSVISISYGECEAENGTTANGAFSRAYQQAVAEGVSIFVSAGDEGAASCDAGATTATHGVGVSGWASTPYNVAVGGTDFGDSVQGSNNQYWSATNTAAYGSALSYIPEIPWNSSCASSLLATTFGFSTVYGTSGFCNSSSAKQNQLQQVVGGSGGPSGCATGSPTNYGIVSGSCQGYAKPSWQTGVAGIPSDGVRDLPDVSLFAGNGIWGHYYVTCWSNLRQGGASCAGDPSNWAGAGGTSFSSPIMAGIQALVNQSTGSSQGNPNYTYYKLAAAQYTDAGLNACNSSSGNGAASSCSFYDVTQGDIEMNCSGTIGCFGSAAASTGGFGGRGGRGGGGTYGALSLSLDSYLPAFGTGPGWDFSSGIGTVNAYNLVTNWNSVQ